MARGDRKRVRPQPEDEPAEIPAGERLHRSGLPGSLDHASGDVDEFDAALVRGAHGRAVPPDEEPPDEPSGGSAYDPVDSGEELATATGGSGRGGDGLSLSERFVQAASPPPRGPARGNRVTGFVRASWAELQRVQWPDRPQVFQATGVVLGFVVVAGVYLGVADFVAEKVVNFIL